MHLALFDFDGTITTDDSLIKFIRYVNGDFITAWGLLILSPMLILYKLKLIPNYKAKQWMLSYFFNGVDYQKFKDNAEEYSLNHIDTILRPKAMEKIEWHKKRGHKVVVVSTSIDLWLAGWCSRNNLELIATRLEIKNNKLTGKFASKNCYGMEQVNRIKKNYNLDNYEVVYAYGDSMGDHQMLDLADIKYYRTFN